MAQERITIPFEASARTSPTEVSGILDRPETDRGGCVYLLAHGAGAGMESAFLETIATGLAAAGSPVLRFNYLYTERTALDGRRRPPDARAKLETVHRAALAALAERFADRRVVLSGKSMGGRISSYLAAEDGSDAALVLLGYPLHPPGRPEKLRSEHFAAVAVPALFVQGTRDALGGLDLLQRELERFGGQATLEVVDGADHDFKVKKSVGKSRDEVLQGIVDAIVEWERATFPPA